MIQCSEWKHQWRGGEDWLTVVSIHYLRNTYSFLWQGLDSTGWCVSPLTTCSAGLPSPETLGCCYIYIARQNAHGSFHKTSCREEENLTFYFEALVRCSCSPSMSSGITESTSGCSWSGWYLKEEVSSLDSIWAVLTALKAPVRLQGIFSST